MASLSSRELRAIYPGCRSVIRIDTIWLATEPMDMRAETETTLARVIAVFGAAKPHCAYLFANCRANRIKALVHDGVGNRRAAATLAAEKAPRRARQVILIVVVRTCHKLRITQKSFASSSEWFTTTPPSVSSIPTSSKSSGSSPNQLLTSIEIFSGGIWSLRGSSTELRPV